MFRLPNRILLLGLWLLVPACGPGPETTVALRIHSYQRASSFLYRFPPYLPLPERIRLQVRRSDDLLGKPLISIDQAWSELEEDLDSGRKYLLLTVLANEHESFRYHLKVSSIVTDLESGGLVFDECGTIGNIVAIAGAKLQLDMYTHPGDCTDFPCATDRDCPHESYCLSFECLPKNNCALCPKGAYCDENDQCASACLSGQSNHPCLDGFFCCGEICSIHCPGVRKRIPTDFLP